MLRARLKQSNLLPSVVLQPPRLLPRYPIRIHDHLLRQPLEHRVLPNYVAYNRIVVGEECDVLEPVTSCPDQGHKVLRHNHHLPLPDFIVVYSVAPLPDDLESGLATAHIHYGMGVHIPVRRNQSILARTINQTEYVSTLNI